METPSIPPPATFAKAPTGIPGLDEITRGGFAKGRATLLTGGPGAGKSILALQMLVNGALLFQEPGIFVAFEESAEQIKANAKGFGWDLESLTQKKLFFLDAQPTADLVQSGSFDLDGLLAVLGAKAKEMGAKRIVFDAVDIVLSLLDDAKSERREIYKLHQWLLSQGLTAVITAKEGENQAHLSMLEFMVDCVISLNHNIVHGVSQRNMRVQKFRGSSFDENESPFLLGSQGFETVCPRPAAEGSMKVSDERISSGVERLDAMLGGGYFRQASILLTGSPGTSKTTLAGAFAEAACQNGERVLYVTFDSDGSEIIRNLCSVNIRLQRFRDSGLLRTKSARALNGSAEIHMMRIRKIALEHKTTCLIVDPLSALLKGGDETCVHSVAERLIDWAKHEGITMLCTSLIVRGLSEPAGTDMQISTIADTWIHLEYHVHSGERNRGLSILKSRGTAHSNQVRELILSEKGLTIADAYMAGGEVLMGALRLEKELAESARRVEAESAAKRLLVKLDEEEQQLREQIKTFQLALEAKLDEKTSLAQVAHLREAEASQGRKDLGALRQTDPDIPLGA